MPSFQNLFDIKMNTVETVLKTCRGLILGIGLLLLSIVLQAQPIPLELFVGKGTFLQSTISVARPFAKDSKFNVLTISSFEAHKDNGKNNSSVMITDLTYSITKRINPGIGLTYNSVSGLVPTLGVGFGEFGRRHSITIAPAFLFSASPSLRLIVNLTYKPRIYDQLNLYLASSNLFTYEVDGDHVRSYEKVRIGFDYKSFQFGVGANFDQFGSNRISDRRIGAFVRKEF